MDSKIKLEIELMTPPTAVGFCLQNKKKELSDYQLSTGDNIRFGLVANVKRGTTDAPNFLGEFMQGTPKARFIYICVGEYAGQEIFEWSRRVKIQLSGITWQQVEQVLANPKSKLIASYLATDKHGGPSCASVPLVGGAWCVVNG